MTEFRANERKRRRPPNAHRNHCGIVCAPPIQWRMYMLTDEKIRELIEKLGITDDEFAELVEKTSDEMNVTPGGAMLLLHYRAFNKPKAVETTIDNFTKSKKEGTEDLFKDASEFLSRYALNNHKDDPDWLEKELEMEMKFSKNYSPEKATMLLAYSYGWRNGDAISAFNSKHAQDRRVDCLSLDSLLLKINDDKKIKFLSGIVNRISNVREFDEPKGHKLRATGIEITDGKNKIWINCHDTSPFKSKSTGRQVLGKFLSTKAQMDRTEMIGSIATFMNLDAAVTKNGDLRLSTGPYSNFNYERTEDKSPLGESA